MRERAPQRETIGKGEILFLSHPGAEETFSGYGVTMQPGNEELLVGLLMVDRPHPADPEWLTEVEATFGECELVAMTSVGQRAGTTDPTLRAGERGIACQMQIEPESVSHLHRFPSSIAHACSYPRIAGNCPSPAKPGLHPALGRGVAKLAQRVRRYG